MNSLSNTNPADTAISAIVDVAQMLFPLTGVTATALASTTSTPACIVQNAGTEIVVPSGSASTGVATFRLARGTAMELSFTGTGAENTDGGATLFGYQAVRLPKILGTGETQYLSQTIYVPFRLLSLDFSLGSKVGVAGAFLGTSDRFADGVVIASDYSLAPGASIDPDVEVAGHAVRVRVDGESFAFFRLEIARGSQFAGYTASDATTVNAFVRAL